MLNLSELVALRPDLAALHKVCYFHENQLNYPSRKDSGVDTQRDFHFGWMQVLSALVADVVVFNSAFNRDSFLERIDGLMRKIPDSGQRVLGTADAIRAKSMVLHFPLVVPPLPPVGAQFAVGDGSGGESGAGADGDDDVMDGGAGAGAGDGAGAGAGAGADSGPLVSSSSSTSTTSEPAGAAIGDSTPEAATPAAADLTNATLDARFNRAARKPRADDATRPLLIVWNHRWEHDKNPELFFEGLYSLLDKRVPFRVAVLGQQFSDAPPVFEAARKRLSEAGVVEHWGYAETRAAYFDILARADVVVSTAVHEFYGVAVLEAACMGCYPLCPDRLAYPELFPAVHLYSSDGRFRKRLKDLAKYPRQVREWACATGGGGPASGGWASLRLGRFTWDALGEAYANLLLGR